jgi:hypothetical protein
MAAMNEATENWKIAVAGWTSDVSAALCGRWRPTSCFILFLTFCEGLMQENRYGHAGFRYIRQPMGNARKPCVDA